MGVAQGKKVGGRRCG